MGSTHLIGRDRELAELDERLSRQRLVTLVGPGGIGKTTLARQVAAVAGSRFPLGAHLVDLTRVDEGEAVAETLAGQLGFPSFAALLAAPSDQSALLVLDNCEHVLDDAAAVIDELLRSCEAPTVLATSRSPLDVPGEAVVVLGPLPVPPPGLVDARSPALTLFCERARDAGARVDEDQLEMIADLCRALDGVPLALEIAAARARTMTPAEILARLGDLDTLARPRYRGRERHRSLRATIEWSYAQLAPEDQRCFDRLAVFAGDFTAEAAHAVAADEGIGAVESLDQLQRLVDASLLVSEPAGPVTRFRQLVALRTFARERLDSRGEWAGVWERFIDHVTDWSVTTALSAADRWDPALLGGLLAHYDSHMAALRWCVEHDEDPTRAFTLLATLWGVVHQGHAEEIDRWSRKALARWPDPDTTGWADAAATSATCRYLLGAPDEAIALAERALAQAPPSTFSPVTLRRVIAQSHAARGELDEAIAAVDEAIAAARAGVPSLARELEVFRAELAANVGEVDEGLARVRAVHADAEAAGSDLNAVWARSVEASLLLRTDPDATVAVATDALRRSRAIAYPACEWVNLHTLASAALARGDAPGAAGLLLELVELLVARAAETELRNVLRATAVLLHRTGRRAWAELAATAESLPSVSVFAIPGYERDPLPAPAAAPLARRDAVAVARAELRAIIDGGAELTATAPEPEAAESAEAPPVIDLRDEPTGRLERRGDVWEVTWADHAVTVRHGKGVGDLARLLQEPGREIHCLELAGAGVEEPSTGPLIDAAARVTYERRIRDLQDEIEEAEAFHDHTRAERAQVELDTLVGHLASSLGLAGSHRGGTSTAERTRSAVTQRVRATIRRIGQAHPELGRHLEVSVRTGTFCCYRPERPTAWTVKP